MRRTFTLSIETLAVKLIAVRDELSRRRVITQPEERVSRPNRCTLILRIIWSKLMQRQFLKSSNRIALVAVFFVAISAFTLRPIRAQSELPVPRNETIFM